jgi:phosphatidyl-myo-inositol dimannoside synthase
LVKRFEQAIQQFFILPNCVDFNSFVPQARDVKLVERYGVRDNKLVLTVGRLHSHARYKGFDEVIEAMPELLRRFPSLKYMIVGDGDDRGRLAEKVKSLGLSAQIIFCRQNFGTGELSHYCQADAYVMPS